MQKSDGRQETGDYRLGVIISFNFIKKIVTVNALNNEQIDGLTFLLNSERIMIG